MPGKKLTARKRAELKQKKIKQQRRGNYSVLIVFFIIIIGAIVGAYLIFSYIGGDENNQGTNGQVTNSAPIAVKDYTAVPINAIIFYIEALLNDYDIDNNDLKITNITAPEHGTAEIKFNKIEYIPPVNYSGTDYLNYTVSDGKQESTSSVIIFISDNNNPFGLIDTSKGVIVVELYLDKMPITCDNFINLADSEFYNGMIFHRISDDFMIQAGNTYPDGTIKGSPFGNIEFEVSDVEHLDGTISMASTGAGVGGSSQFFICDGAQDFLNGNYAAFGKTIYGFSVLRDIADDVHDDSSPAGGGKPIKDILINSITILDILLKGV